MEAGSLWSSITTISTFCTLTLIDRSLFERRWAWTLDGVPTIKEKLYQCEILKVFRWIVATLITFWTETTHFVFFKVCNNCATHFLTIKAHNALWKKMYMSQIWTLFLNEFVLSHIDVFILCKHCLICCNITGNRERKTKDHVIPIVW